LLRGPIGRRLDRQAARLGCFNRSSPRKFCFESGPGWYFRHRRTFAGNATNLFDPINGHVPLGFSNTAGTTVTVVNPGVEFGFQDPHNTITVDITSSQIIITDVLITNGTNGALTFTLKDSAFSNISSVSDNFAGGDFSLVGDTFTFTTSSFPGPGTFNAVFNVGAVLEPSTWAMMILGFAGVGYMAYRRRKSAMLAA
jgi:hypothetical protein